MPEIWFRRLGFSRNPFSIKPAAFSYELFGTSVGEVLSGIDEGKVLFVEAPLGYGKTTLLKSIISRYGGRKKVVYAHTLPDEKLDVKSLLKRSSLANYITGSIPTGIILVVDEAQNLQPETGNEIMEFYRNGNLKAAVLFGVSYSRSATGDELAKAMNGSLVRLGKPTPEQAILLVRSRIGNLPLLPNDAIMTAYRKAHGSPRRLLQICEDACRTAIETGKMAVASNHLEAAEDAQEPPKRKARPRKKREEATPIVKAQTEVVVPKVAARETVTVAKPRPKPIRKKAKAAAARKAAKPKAPKTAKKAVAKPGRAAAKPIPVRQATIEAEATEGSYWGEFMGMQK